MAKAKAKPKTKFRIALIWGIGWFAWHVDAPNYGFAGKSPLEALERLKQAAGLGGYPRG